MSLALHCPECGAELGGRAGSPLVCSVCERSFGETSGLRDLRVHPEIERAPEPLEVGALEPFFTAHARGAAYRTALEELLLSLDEHQAELAMQLLREGSGAWFPLVRAGSGRLLFLGNALSGAVTPLAAFGFQVTILDPAPDRVRFAVARAEAHTSGAVTGLIGGDGALLPFDDRTFDVVVQHDGLPGPRRTHAHDFAECRRVTRGEVVLVADNRWAYKRSTGKRAQFHVPSPLEYVQSALSPQRHERTLVGYRELFATSGFVAPRSYALYPHRHNFSHIATLDTGGPDLNLGPLERKNRFKLAARSLGFFPWLTPSFAIFGARTEIREPRLRLERIFSGLAERIGEEIPDVDHIVSTGDNAAIVHTRARGASIEEEAGRWILHIPLNPKNRPRLEHHHRMLAHVRDRFPSMPVPEPLFLGDVEGVWLTCERRIPGTSVPNMFDQRGPIVRMFAEVAEYMSALVVRPSAPLRAEEFELEFGARIDLVARHAGVPSTVKGLERLRAAMRERLVGCAMPRVFYHGNLRGKHVQVDDTGHVRAFLDWSTAEPEGVPYQDLLHLLVHERQQEDVSSVGDAWRLICAGHALRDDERCALQGYADRVGLDRETAQALTELYPVLVGAMAEKNWDYSRPRWLHRQYGL